MKDSKGNIVDDTYAIDVLSEFGYKNIEILESYIYNIIYKYEMVK
jgi:hypothetical protein